MTTQPPFPKRSEVLAALVLLAGTTLAAMPFSASIASAQDTSGIKHSAPWPGGVWSPGEAIYNAKLDKQLTIRMSDGVTLRADVSYPIDPATGERAKGPFPVLLTQTPYLDTKPTAGDYFVKRGYIFVTAYVRGTTSSGGDFGFFDDREAKDGAELVNWAAKLENSNGTVGLNGGSYAGINQFLTVRSLGPDSPVKAMAPSCMGAELYREPYVSGGLWTQTLNFQRVIGGAMGGKTAATGAALVEEVNAGGARAYDGPYWAARAPMNAAQAVVDAGVPALLWSSSEDIYVQSSLELYTYLQNAAAKRPIFSKMDPDQKPTGRYQIVMGQGGHCENIDERITLEWYDTWLKGTKTGMEQTATPVHVHEATSNRWLNTGVYPPVSNYTKYYLSSDRSLSVETPKSAGRDSIAWAQPGAGSVLQFDTPIFKDGATLAGPISASLSASSSTKNLELIATVQVVDPSGTVSKLSSGTLVGSLAENDPDLSWTDVNGVPVRPYGTYENEMPLVPDAVGKYDFAVAARFASIPSGGKLRLTLTTQTPTDKCGPPLGLDPCFPTKPQAAELEDSVTTLHYGPEAGSSLNLPLLPAKCWASTDNPGIPFWSADVTVAANAPCQRRAEQ